MQYNNKELCDFCFEEIMPHQVCPRCGLTHSTYNSADLLPVGTNLLGKYIVGRVLGRGGFGATYLAFSSAQQRRVAIKEFFPNGIVCRGKGETEVSLVSEGKRSIFEKGSRRFYKEAETISTFNANNNVVSVYEFFKVNDTVYYAMEYLDGIDLKGYVAKRGGRISEEEALTILRHVCAALKDVHSTGTFHLDISPDNIFLCTDHTVKLIDFGAAKQVVGEESQSLEVVLKQGFAPPEQYSSKGNQGPWTDLYALGGTIFYALTGAVPTEAMSRRDGDEDMMFQKLQGVSPAMRSILEKCMKLNVKERFQSTVELEGVLRSIPIQDVVVNAQKYVKSVHLGSSKPYVSKPYVSTIPNSIPNPVPGAGPWSVNMSQYKTSYIPVQPVPPSVTLVSPKEDRSNHVLKGAIIGGIAALVVVLLVVVLMKVINPAPPAQPPMNPAPPAPPISDMQPAGGGQPPAPPQP